MDFFKVKKFRKAHKPNPEKDSEDKPVLQPEDPKNENGHELGKSDNVDSATEAEEDDDDFIMNEVKRRLKELRRNSFMVLIPEESCPEDEEEEEEGETSSSEWRDVEAEGLQVWCGFDAFYNRYCERMLFFDRLSSQQLKEVGSKIPSTPSPRSASKKLTSPLSCLSLKKIEEPEDETENLQQPGNDPCQDLETAYVAQVCLTWEALHCQYTLLSQKISCQPENPACYNHSAQQFQQFQVLLQRFIENEPFEQGLRAEIYARTRISLPKLLQVPKLQGSDQIETEEKVSDLEVLAPDLIRIIESSILTFRLFLKMDKKKSNGVRNLFGGQNQMATPHQQIQSSLEKRGMKLKELRRRKKGSKKKSWPAMEEEVELLLGLIDVKVISRVLRMVRISKEQLFWCEEKMKKLDLSYGKLQRDPSPILFPC
uniref:Ribosomal protein L34Ae n=1 Tax=Davidia involucrata TaxID=16924 RepID=A0A5B6ZIF4_DAVIN